MAENGTEDNLNLDGNDLGGENEQPKDQKPVDDNLNFDGNDLGDEDEQPKNSKPTEDNLNLDGNATPEPTSQSTAGADEFNLLNPIKAQAPEVRKQTAASNDPSLKHLQLYDHQTLLLMALQKLKDPENPNQKLLSNKDFVHNLGNNKEEAHEKLVNTSSNLKDLPKLGIPKLTNALANGTINQEVWNNAKKAAFMEALTAQKTDGESAKFRAVKAPIGAVNFTDPEYPDNLWTDKKGHFPPVLTYQGNKDLLNQGPSAAVVGDDKLIPSVDKITENYAARLSIDKVNSVTGLETDSDKATVQGNMKYLNLLKDAAAKANKDRDPEKAANYQKAYEQAGKPIAVLAKGINTGLSKKNNSNLANDIVKNGGVIVSPYSPAERPSGKEYYDNVRERYRLEALMTDGIVITQSGKGELQDTGRRYQQDSKYALLEAFDQTRPIAALDMNQVEQLRNDAKENQQRMEYNQMNIMNGRAVGLSANMNDQNLVNQFANFEDASRIRKHARLTKLAQGQDPTQGAGNNNKNNDNDFNF